MTESVEDLTEQTDVACQQAHVLKLLLIRHLRAFGFGNQSGIAASREFVHGDEILAMCLRIAEHVSMFPNSIFKEEATLLKNFFFYSRMTRIHLHDVVNVFLSLSLSLFEKIDIVRRLARLTTKVGKKKTEAVVLCLQRNKWSWQPTAQSTVTFIRTSPFDIGGGGGVG